MNVEHDTPPSEVKLMSFEKMSDKIADFLRNDLYNIKSSAASGDKAEKALVGHETLNPFDGDSVTRFLIHNETYIGNAETGVCRYENKQVKQYTQQLIHGPRRDENIATMFGTDNSFTINPDMFESELAALPKQHLFAEQQNGLPEVGNDRRDSKARIARTALAVASSAGGGVASAIAINVPVWAAIGIGAGTMIGGPATYRLTQRSRGSSVFDEYQESIESVSDRILDPKRGALRISNEFGVVLSDDYEASINKAFSSDRESAQSLFMMSHDRTIPETSYSTSPAGAIALAVRLEPSLTEAWVGGMDDQIKQLAEWTNDLDQLREDERQFKLRKAHTEIDDPEYWAELIIKITNLKTQMNEAALAVLDATLERYGHETLLTTNEEIRNVAHEVVDIPDKELAHSSSEQLGIFRHMVADIIIHLDDTSLGTANSMKQYVDGSAVTFTERRHVRQIYEGFFTKFSGIADIPKWSDVAATFDMDLPQ